MVALWGSKKSDDQNGSGSATPHESEEGRSGSASRRDYDRRDPDERTRLLQSRPAPPPRPDGYLDPDDPAVSQISRASSSWSWSCSCSCSCSILTWLSGITVQPMVRSLPPLPDPTLSRHQLHLVDHTARLQLRLTALSALPRIRLL